MPSKPQKQKKPYIARLSFDEPGFDAGPDDYSRHVQLACIVWADGPEAIDEPLRALLLQRRRQDVNTGDGLLLNAKQIDLDWFVEVPQDTSVLWEESLQTSPTGTSSINCAHGNAYNWSPTDSEDDNGPFIVFADECAKSPVPA